MDSTLFGIVIANLQTFVHDELATFWGVDSQAQKLSRNLTAIHAVLQDAEEKQITSHAVKDWLQKLSDAAYVLDDILDEYTIESNRLQSEQENSRLAQKAHNMYLTRLNPKIILFRRGIGKRMKEIADIFHEIDEERRRFELRAGITFIERQPEDDEWRHTSSVITEHKVYGRDQDKEKIVEFLLSDASNNSDDELSIYPIVGIGGLGKTTLAQLVFNDDRVSKYFDLKIWVCVSSDFSIGRILQSIIESTAGQNPNLTTLESMQKKVQEELLGKRYLLVLDDVWNDDPVKWEKLKYLLQCGSGTKGASILVTTRLESVASIMGTCLAHHLLPLSEDDNWLLFKHHAFGLDREERAELVAIGKEIVKKCAGSPLASKALGSLLHFKNEEKQWLSVKISKLWDIPEGNAIMRALRISYFNLNLSLRRCFSFCAIYPQDFRIVKEQLIHLWMANGLIKSRGNLEVEEVGNEVWDELCQKSFFQEVRTDLLGKITFKMHDLFHELAQSLMGEECVVSKSANLTNLSSRVHHVSCLDFYESLNLNMGAFKKVESLRTFIKLYPTFSNSRVLPAINSLRVLSTSSSKLSALKSLTHLRYLSLHNSSTTTLPKSVSRLQKLQILKLEDCDYLSCLPKHLTRLKDLRHLVIKNCESLVAMPPKIGKLKCLKTLSTFIVHSKEGLGLAELHDLQLEGKLHIKGLENVPNACDAKDANLIGKKDLNCLYLSWGSNANSQCNDSERVLEALEPHSNLKSFGMKGYRGIQMANWMSNTSLFSSLVNVILYDCNNCARLPPLGKLPHLTSLFVCGVKDVKYIDHDSYEGVEEKAFKSLKKLTLFRMPNLERMLRDEGAEMLPLLSDLSISCVPKFELPCLPSVEHLQIQGLKSIFDYNGNKDMASFPEAIVRNMHYIKTLRIEYFYERVLPDELGSLNSLQELVLFACDELESFSENVLQGLSSLRTLKIMCCDKLKSLSEGIRHLTHLERLEIWACPELVALPSNMNQLTALCDVTIFGEDNYRIIPEGLQRIPSLQILTLYNVDSLPEWLGDMTSLQQLHIGLCPELRSLPSSFRHLTNLHKLYIDECPKLEKRCKKVTGKDWKNIAHIRQFELVPVQEETFCEKIRIKWNMRRLNRDQRYYLSPDYEFDRMVDQL